MCRINRGRVLMAGWVVCLSFTVARAQDWPQWRGVHRDAKASNFTAPATWPAELTKVWSVSVGDAVATPALQGNRLYVFTRQDDQEVVRCLNADSGEVLWESKYDAPVELTGDRGYPGPRSSPTVAEGKVVTLGVNGILSCRDAQTGEVAWRNDEYEGSVPRFHTASSPIVHNQLCIVQLGGEDSGVIAAFDLSSGERKWMWSGEGAAYASPMLVTVDNVEAVVTQTNQNVVAVRASDGHLLWETPYEPVGRGYNAATAIVDGKTIIYSGSSRGSTAAELSGNGDAWEAKELWANKDNSVQFNSPVLKDGYVYGLSNLDVLYCINAATGETAWSAPMGVQPQAEEQPAAGGRRGRRGRGGGGYGSIVDAGPVLFVLTPLAQLVVMEANPAEFKQLASYKVSEGRTYAYPVIAGDRIYIKDDDAVTLWQLK